MTEFHTLTITTEGPPTRATVFGYNRIELDEYAFGINCVEGGCHGWQECTDAHTVDGYDGPNEGPYESEDEAPWFEEDEFVFHGVAHEWRYGWGWTVDYPGCVLAANDGLSDYVDEILREYGPGAYLVDDDWSDDMIDNLTVVSMADGSPLPEKGWAVRNVVEEES